jgi:putative addiction module CopG family antidote
VKQELNLTKAISWHMLVGMAYALAKENEAFIERMLAMGRFNNQSEVVREALRRMEREESSYLNPAPLTEGQLKEVYQPNSQAERQERLAGRTALKSIRRAAKKQSGIENL